MHKLASTLFLLLAFAFPALAQTVEIKPTDRVLGKADAPVTIVEYASLTCSHCADFHTNVLPKVKKEWIDTGRARLVYRDFPLDNFALGAAMIAQCAEPSRYFPLLSAMFETQGQWMTGANPAQELQKVVKLGGISEEQFNACLQRKDILETIQAGQKEAQEKWKVNSTPTFLINGKTVSGSMPYEQFDKLLQEAAKK